MGVETRSRARSDKATLCIRPLELNDPQMARTSPTQRCRQRILTYDELRAL